MSEHEFQPTSMLSGRCEFCNLPADKHDDVTPNEFSDPANWHPIEEHPYLNDPPKVTMTDTLRTRIVAVQAEHVEGQREECGCGQQGNATYREHLADAVMEVLNDE